MVFVQMPSPAPTGYQTTDACFQHPHGNDLVGSREARHPKLHSSASVYTGIYFPSRSDHLLQQSDHTAAVGLVPLALRHALRR